MPYDHAIVARETEHAMDAKYTEFPGALLVALMLICWAGVLVAGIAGALIA